ncbi:UNVERIFIED_CONTAM: hypothetical protein PYX00_010098 [Menopon gallinae]|uniref:PHD-type domain-containing protein n=1 Tax=Menopon gallinae TaxID=328185 RepID=A0AAW2HE78_9NEOP
MANVEEYGDFGSHFLDSMLEVEMTEEDGEVKIPQADDAASNNRDLPPCPMFDLESETYKDLYRNAMVQQANVLRPVPAASVPGNAIAVPVPSSPMIVIHSNMLKGNSVSLKSNSIATAVQTVITSSKSPILESSLTKTDEPQESILGILQKIFKPEYVKSVFTKQEPPNDISKIGPEEEKFYESAFKDVTKVQFCRLHCTICGKHIGCGKDVEKKISVHSMLKVLTCKECYEFYGDGNFPCDDGDHCEIYCRWCGQGGALICCSFCPKVFCKKCVRRNYDRNYLKEIEKASDWACFICAQKPLWPHRAVCRALMEYTNMKKSDPTKPAKDTSICCKLSSIEKKIVTEEDRNKIFLSGGQTIQLNHNDHPSAEGTKQVAQPPAAAAAAAATKHPFSDNGPVVLKNYGTAIKLNDQKKSSVAFINKAQPIAVTPKIASTTTMCKNNVSSNSIPSLSSLSGLGISQLINTPVYHGQTLITPPSSRLNSVQKKPSSTPNVTQNVKVSVADCVNININKIPVAKIPNSAQGVILRLNFPDNKVQLIRVVTEGKGSQKNASFPMPSFDNSENLDFLEESLEDSFKLTKMLFERLTKIKERLNSKTRFTKESVYKSSVKKLSFIYEKARELMKELDDNLLSSYENWRNEKDQDELKVVDMSEEDSRDRRQVKSADRSTGLVKRPRNSDKGVEVGLIAGKIRPTARSLRSSQKRNSVSSVGSAGRKETPAQRRASFARNPVPEVVDLNKFPQKKRKVGRPRKRPLPEEEAPASQATEKDPLAMSDHEEPEVKINGQTGSGTGCNERTGGSLTSVIEIKEEKIDEEYPVQV